MINQIINFTISNTITTSIHHIIPKTPTICTDPTKAGGLFVSYLRSETDLKSHNKKREPERFSLDVSYKSPTTVDEEPKLFNKCELTEYVLQTPTF